MSVVQVTVDHRHLSRSNEAFDCRREGCTASSKRRLVGRDSPCEVEVGVFT
jgi:hypothetical protein